MPAPKNPPKAKAKRLLLACWDVLYRLAWAQEAWKTRPDWKGGHGGASEVLLHLAGGTSTRNSGHRAQYLYQKCLLST